MPYTLNASVTPPKTERRAKKITQLGRERTDDYFWLKDPHWQKMMSAPETLDKDIRAHLEAENTYHRRPPSQPLMENMPIITATAKATSTASMAAKPLMRRPARPWAMKSS